MLNLISKSAQMRREPVVHFPLDAVGCEVPDQRASAASLRSFSKLA